MPIIRYYEICGIILMMVNLRYIDIGVNDTNK